MKIVNKLVCAATLTLSVSAEQRFITYTNSFEASGNWGTTLQLPQFNPAIGDLLLAEVTITSINNVTIQLENKVAIPANVNLAVKTTTTVIAPIVADGYEFNSTFVVNKSLEAFDQKVDYAGSSGVTTNKVLIPYMSFLPPKARVFIGGGLFSLNIANFNIASGTNVTVSAKNYWVSSKVNVNVLYKYEQNKSEQDK